MNIDNSVSNFLRLTAAQKKSLEKIGIRTARDILYHFPSRYSDISKIKKIAGLNIGDNATIYGRVISARTIKTFRKKIPIGEAVVQDDTGKIKAIWFHQAYIAKMLKIGDFVKLTGKITTGKNGIYIANPEFTSLKEIPIDVGETLFGDIATKSCAYAVYPERRGLSSRWFYHAIQKIFKSGVLDDTEDSLPKEILQKYNLPSLKTALVWIHTPKKEKDSEAARKRFAFEEIFFIQLERQRARKEYEKNSSFSVNVISSKVKKFTQHFPFKMTEGQQKAINKILEDIQKPKPMSRLLEGDVGSGKTAVAATTAFAVASSSPAGQNFGNLQVAYMAPTEILAKQHFEAFIEYFKHLPIKIGLITASGCRKYPSKVSYEKTAAISRAQLLKWVAGGEIPILIGTHTLIQKSVKFQNLAYIIIDEQHRFGTRQRAALAQKERRAPHLLSMTATPIPRTLALTIYGDLDLTLLNEMPRGRKNIITNIISSSKREDMYSIVRAELAKGRQAYVICPRIDEPDPNKALALNVKSVKEETKRLEQEVFPEHNLAMLHSKMKPKEKDDVMQDFIDKKTDILVATSVIEVGINVPNATVIIIEGAERFGLAQLHQLRGRVLRSNHQAYCFLCTDSGSQKTLERLQALKTAKNGFELAELDLALRGSGELSGGKQWGISDIGMEAIKNIKMVETARETAKDILGKDAELNTYPLIKNRLDTSGKNIHFE